MLLTIEQAAKYLGISTMTVYRLVRQGKLAGHKTGSDALTIREKDAHAYLAEHGLPLLRTTGGSGPQRPLSADELRILAADRLPESTKTKRGRGRPRRGADVRQVYGVRLPPGLAEVAKGQAESLTAAVEQALIEWLRRKSINIRR